MLFERPGLAELLTAVFARFAAVGLWSMASREWVDFALGTEVMINTERTENVRI